MVTGGSTGTSVLDSTEIFSDKVWKTVNAKLPFPVDGLQLATINNRVLSFGNSFYLSWIMLNNVFILQVDMMATLHQMENIERKFLSSTTKLKLGVWLEQWRRIDVFMRCLLSHLKIMKNGANSYKGWGVADFSDSPDARIPYYVCYTI